MPTAAPAKPAVPKVPKMSELTGGDVTPSPTPSPSPSPTPAPTEVPKPTVTPAPGANEEPSIPTSIIGAERAVPPKTQAAIIEERRKAKVAKEEASAATGDSEQFKIRVAELESELTKLRAEREKIERERGDFQTLATTREKEIEEVRNGYFQQHQPVLDVSQDETFTSAHQNMVTKLKENLPITVRTPAGEKRVFLDHLMRDPAKVGGLHNILEQYDRAVGIGNEETIDMAVNAMAQWLGADVDMTGTDKSAWKVLDKSDPAFSKIEEALRSASPQYRIKAERYGHIQNEAPVIAKRQYEQKIGTLRETLKGQVFMSRDAAVTALRSDPNDSVALFSMIASESPEFRQHVEATLAGYAETFATVNNQLKVPTLTSNDPAAIQQHRAVVATHQQRLARAMRNAVVGECIGPILSSLIAERDAAEARAAAAADVTNPGSPGSGGAGGGGSNEPKIPTSIIGAERK